MHSEIKKISSCKKEIWETRKLFWKPNISGLKSVTNPQGYMHMRKSLRKGSFLLRNVTNKIYSTDTNT